MRRASPCIGLAPTAPLFWARDRRSLIVSGIAFPSLMSLLSKRVGVDQQGQLQGALAILFGAGQLIGPLALHQRLRLVDRRRARGCTCPGLPMLVGAACCWSRLVALAFVYARPATPAAERPAEPPPKTPLAVARTVDAIFAPATSAI